MNLSLIRKIVSEYPILVVCGVVAPLALILLMIRGPKIDSYAIELDELERQWRFIQMNMERSAGLDEHIDRAEAGIEMINNRLMDVEKVAVNHEFFYDLEEQAGITLVNFGQDNAFDGERLPIGYSALRHFSVIPYKLTVSGTFEQILGFLNLLNRQEFIVRLDELTLSQPTDLSGNPTELLGDLKCHVLAARNE